MIIFATIFIIILGFLVGPIAQPEDYHHFADQKGWDVYSNVLYAIAGIWGLFIIKKQAMWYGVAIGLILTAIGSSYYHLAPDDARLVWDRIPMTIVFMSLSAILIGKRNLWTWMLLFGVFSVLYWYHTGDLRLYLGVQLFTIAAAGIAVLKDKNWGIAIVVLLFGLARVFELYDHEIWNHSRHFISGHTLKHLSSGMAGIWLIYMLSRKKI